MEVAIGAIALGITLCNGIATYCHAWRHQSEDVQSLAGLCEALRQLLQDIEQRVGRSQILDPAIVQKLNDMIKSCDDHIQAALRITKKYTAKPTSTRWKGTAQELAKKLKFPFKKNTLEELRSIISEYRSNVDTALAFLQLDITISTKEDFQALRTTIATNHDQTLQEMRTTQRQFNQLFGPGPDQKFLLLKHDMVRQIDGSLNTVVAGLSVGANSTAGTESWKQLNALSSILHDGSEGPKRPTQSSVPSEPPNFRSCNSSMNKRKHNQGLAMDTSLECHCGPIFKQSYSFGRSWLFKEREKSVLHKRSCPLWYRSITISEYSLRVLIIERLLIFGSMTVSSSPFGSMFGLRISQNLNCTVVVTLDSPAFKVLGYHLPRVRRRQLVITSCLEDMRAVFQSGLGSPYDMLSDGTTLIEQGFRFLGCTVSFDTNAIWQLTRGLLELGVEVSLDESSASKKRYRRLFQQLPIIMFHGYDAETVIDDSTQFTSRVLGAIQLLSWLLKHNTEIPFRPISNDLVDLGPSPTLKIMLETLRSDEDFSIAVECGKLSTAIIHRDKPRVETILCETPHLLKTERNNFGQTPIHLAIGWPDGLKLILEVADKADLHQVPNKGRPRLHDNFSPGNTLDLLGRAISSGCVESIQLLADAGTKFPWWIGTDIIRPEVSRALLDIVLKRYQQFLDFGEKNLPEETFSSLQIPNLGSYELKAMALRTCLFEEKIPIPAYLACSLFEPGSDDLAFAGDISPETARALFEAGITNFDCEFEGLTTLMMLAPPNIYSYPESYSRYFRCVQYFVEKGVRLDQQIPSAYICERVPGHGVCRNLLISNTIGGLLESQKSPVKWVGTPHPSDNESRSHQAIHRIASSCWRSASKSERYELVGLANMGSSPIWRSILQSTCSDPCLCACASGGCRPISLALKYLVNGTNTWLSGHWRTRMSHYGSDERIFDPRHWEVTYDLLGRLNLLIDGLQTEQLVADIIRFLTFSALELTHTCCLHAHNPHSFRPSPRDKSVMVTVFDPEEVQRIQEEDFHDLKLPLPEFLLGKWQETMFEELSIKDEIPESTRQQMEEIGVRICPSEPSTGEDDHRKTSTATKPRWEEVLREKEHRRRKHGEDARAESVASWKSVEKDEDEEYAEWMRGVRKKIEDR